MDDLRDGIMDFGVFDLGWRNQAENPGQVEPEVEEVEEEEEEQMEVDEGEDEPRDFSWRKQQRLVVGSRESKKTYWEWPAEDQRAEILWDFGINLRHEQNPKSIFIHGPTAALLCHHIMSPERVEADPGPDTGDAELLARIAQRARTLEDEEVELLILFIRERNPQLTEQQMEYVCSKMRRDERTRREEQIDFEEGFEQELLDYFQESIELPMDGDDEGIESSAEPLLSYDSLLSLANKSKFHMYPTFATPGFSANVHTGKIQFDFFNRHSDDVRLELPEQASVVRGMQVYTNSSRVLGQSRVKKNLEDIRQLPALFQFYLTQDPDFVPNLDDYRQQLHKIFLLASKQVKDVLAELMGFKQIGARVEFFLQYRPGHNFLQENFGSAQLWGSFLRSMETKRFLEYYRLSLERAIQPVAKVLRHDMALKASGSYSTYHSALTPDCKAALIAHAEMVPLTLSLFPYRGYFVPILLRELNALEQCKSYRFAAGVIRKLPEADMNYTGLRFGVAHQFFSEPNQLVRRPRLNGRNLPKMAPSVYTLASLLKGKIRLPLDYALQLHNAELVLKRYGAATPEPETGADNLDSEEGDETIEVNILSRLNYRTLALLDASERLKLMTELATILHDLYNANWHFLMSSPTKSRGRRNRQSIVEDGRDLPATPAAIEYASDVLIRYADFPCSRKEFLRFSNRYRGRGSQLPPLLFAGEDGDTSSVPRITDIGTCGCHYADSGCFILLTVSRCLLHPDTFVTICFNPNGNEPFWSSDPSRLLYMRLLEICKKIRDSVTPRQYQGLPEAADPLEKRRKPYSKAHLDYVIAQTFVQIRTPPAVTAPGHNYANDGSESDEDCPIVWQQSTSRGRMNAGSATLLEILFEEDPPTEQPDQAQAGTVVSLPAHGVQLSTSDQFHVTFSGSISTSRPTFFNVLVFRVVIGLVIATYRRRRTLRLTPTAIYQTILNTTVSGVCLRHFWDSDTSLNEYVKNNLKNILFQDFRFLEIEVAEYDEERAKNKHLRSFNIIQRRKAEFELALRGMSTHEFLSIHRAGLNGDWARTFDWDDNLWSCTFVDRVLIDDLLDSNKDSIEKALSAVLETGAITPKFVKRLMLIRKEWQDVRVAWDTVGNRPSLTVDALKNIAKRHGVLVRNGLDMNLLSKKNQT